MIRMIEKNFFNDDLEIVLTSYIDDKQNVWFRGKDIATILGYIVNHEMLLRDMYLKIIK